MRNTIHLNEINEAINCLKSEKNNLYVGLCGTQYMGSDRYAVVITEVISPKCVRVADMLNVDYNEHIKIDEKGNNYIPVNEMYTYVQVNKNKTGFESKGKLFKLRKNGRWIVEGDDLWSTGSVHFGIADEYRDPSF